MLNLEANIDQRLPGLRQGTHLRDTVTQLDLVRKLLVLRDSRVPAVRHTPLVHTEDSTRLQHPADLLVDALPRRRMDRRLDRVDGVEAVLPELVDELHEVAFREGHLVLEARILRVLACTLDLEVVVVEANDVDVREGSDFPSGTADTAADVEHPHTWPEVHLGSEVVFMAGK